jgi:hypothetical protein
MKTNKYAINIEGRPNAVADALEAILERQDSALNLGYLEFKIEKLNWGFLTDGSSQATGEITLDSPLRKMDIQIMREEYDVAIKTKKLAVAA